ncbi:ParB N-terminal domain-containing protein [Stutzerimonas nitrititolerans]|uniref:ParB N-terminal domain-containing protein n=1 Tax=Stutzerimonas nitrititolerans TaxID=2482751 RepID=UPI0028A9D1BD|nr:ParB N-terminal domain-containing protein [Stutzerimonas nitrititolerans]
MTSLQKIALTDLHFDPENPRLPEHLKNAPDIEVLEYLLIEANLIELMLSIGQQDFFIGEPLLVAPDAAGRIIVVEGNRRLGALKMLQDTAEAPVIPGQVRQAREMAKFKPNDIPCLVFGNREEILTYLGYRHITGIKEWGPIAKARYLRQLRERHGDDHAEAHRILAKEIGSKSSHVAKLLTGLALVEKARDLGILHRLRLKEDDIPFSLMTTGIGYPGICDFIGIAGSSDVQVEGLNEKHFAEFFEWVFDKNHGPTVLGESRNFDKLNRVVANEHAVNELRRGATLDQADLYTSGPLDTLRKLLKETEERLGNAQNALNIAEGIEAADLAQADRIRKAAAVLHGSIRSLLDPEE